jgi:hypothetical protein
MVDYAQSGGLYGTADGLIIGDNPGFIEIKGASKKKRSAAKGAKALDQYEINGIRSEGASWRHLLLVCRPDVPSDWTSAAEYKRCGFVLGYVSRRGYAQALRAAGLSETEDQRVAVTPWSRNERNWLGRHIAWVRFEDLDLAWWERHVLGS